ncbi:MAG: multicopper oxidase family protein [Terracidiphilus sp.]|jgi:FtsP/CotA-like multicopper oxidase with cupredoxin domain
MWRISITGPNDAQSLNEFGIEPQTLPQARRTAQNMNRRDFLINSGRVLAGTSLFGRSAALQSQSASPADYMIRIAPIRLEIAPGKIVHTTAFNGKVPGDLIRVREGQQVTIDVVNDTDASDIVHWHGMEIPSLQDGAMEEGSPEIAPHGGVLRYNWTARPAGCRWYHTHMSAGHNLNRATYTGEFGFLMVDPAANPARYDREVFLALHDWDGHVEGGAEGYREVVYDHSTINDRMLGFGEPIRVREGQRVLFHILNASATLMHNLALPGHHFLVTALDGNAVPVSALVETVRLGPAERVDAIVEMNQPGVWVFGETDGAIRKSGMGVVVEYSGHTGIPMWKDPSQFDFQYEKFGSPSRDVVPDHDEVVVPLVFKPKFEGYGDFDHWTINGYSWPKAKLFELRAGARYRLVFDNQSMDVHPVHLHRHTFELKSLSGKPTGGVLKDVVLVAAGKKVEAVFTADNPGKTLFHCHQQDHMDSGFMMLFDYV